MVPTIRKPAKFQRKAKLPSSGYSPFKLGQNSRPVKVPVSRTIVPCGARFVRKSAIPPSALAIRMAWSATIASLLQVISKIDGEVTP
jgi:hypothetical protein